MRQFFGRVVVGLGLVVLLAGTAAGQTVPKSIFDDNGDHPFERPDQAQPAPQPTPTPDNSTPAPAPTPDNSATRPPPPPPPTVTPASPPAPVVAAALIPVPTADAQQASLKLIDELYKDDIANATTPALKIELAKKMMGVAEQTANDPVGKYVLLVQAKDVAIASGDPPTAFASLDELAEGYQIDYVAMKLDLFTKLARFVESPEDRQTYVEGLNRWMDKQVAIDHYDAAKTAGDLALQITLRSDDSGLYKTTTAHMKRVGEIAAAYSAVKGSLDTLASAPNDPAANLAVGRFYCFIKGDWKRGLPMMALGDDVTLCALAKQELGGAADVDGQIAMGDAWWEQGEKQIGSMQEQIRRHAVLWYQLASPQLAGLAKAKVDKRIEELTKLYPENVAAGVSGKVVTNSIGMKLVWIKPGTFLMGSPPDEPRRTDQEPLHRVTLTKGFYIDVTTVTQAQWNAMETSNPSHYHGDKLPVDSVSWDDAVDYCKKFSAKEGKHYRLPTEAEWEYACRAGTTTMYYFGNDEHLLGRYFWINSNSGKTTHPVGQKRPNAWGLYDMGGNVRNWCEDGYGPLSAEAMTDPCMPDQGNGHVQRGASWESGAGLNRSAYRRGGTDERKPDVGFRVVMDPD